LTRDKWWIVVILVDAQFNAIDPHLYYVGATSTRGL